jgi:hypothetical protein
MIKRILFMTMLLMLCDIRAIYEAKSPVSKVNRSPALHKTN